MKQDVIRIGLAGLGTVGAATVRLLQSETAKIQQMTGKTPKIVAVCARSKAKARGVDLKEMRWVDHAASLAEDPEVDLVVELIGGSDGPARALVEAALSKGKPVVTANKALIARRGAELAQLAESHGTQLRFEAAVAAAIPVVQGLKDGVPVNHISRVVGILNGTCNFILTAMDKSGQSFAEVLSQAQSLGYAEADPSFDIDGIDTAHKLSILTSLAFGTRVDFDSVHTEGIRDITPLDLQFARQLGYRIKLLGISRLGEQGIEQRVYPCMIEERQPMAQVAAEYNAVELEGHACGKMFIEGRGAGGDATASAVLSDIVSLLRGYRSPTFGLPHEQLTPLTSVPVEDHMGSYYIRLRAVDRPGVLSAISTIFYRENISVKSCIQHSHQPGEPVDVVITTHHAHEGAMKRALARIADLDFTLEKPYQIRIESL